MSTTKLDVYLTGLRNQHAVETQAIGTLQNEMSYTRDYPELHAKMRLDKERSTAGAGATVAGFAHLGSNDDVLKNVLVAIGTRHSRSRPTRLSSPLLKRRVPARMPACSSSR